MDNETISAFRGAVFITSMIMIMLAAAVLIVCRSDKTRATWSAVGMVGGCLILLDAKLH